MNDLKMKINVQLALNLLHATNKWNNFGPYIGNNVNGLRTGGTWGYLYSARQLVPYVKGQNSTPSKIILVKGPLAWQLHQTGVHRYFYRQSQEFFGVVEIKMPKSLHTSRKWGFRSVYSPIQNFSVVKGVTLIDQDGLEENLPKYGELKNYIGELRNGTANPPTYSWQNWLILIHQAETFEHQLSLSNQA